MHFELVLTGCGTRHGPAEDLAGLGLSRAAVGSSERPSSTSRVSSLVRSSDGSRGSDCELPPHLILWPWEGPARGGASAPVCGQGDPYLCRVRVCWGGFLRACALGSRLLFSQVSHLLKRTWAHLRAWGWRGTFLRCFCQSHLLAVGEGWGETGPRGGDQVAVACRLPDSPLSLCRRGLPGQLCGQRDGALGLIPWEPGAPAL